MKYIAMFLPQFHECEYNSNWWGKGFTEWENVKRSEPLFPGHRQPRIPAEGYFDLGSVTEISRQAQQAKSYGISAFSIYHYWYEGKRPLGKPLDVILENQDLEIEFSLCWANHAWTRSWKNRSGSLDVLIEQTYENDTASREKHFLFLSKVFADARYTNVDGRPLFQIYMPEAIPNCEAFITELRAFVRNRNGTEIYVSAMLKGWHKSWKYLKPFDSVTFFQPSLALFSTIDIFGESKELSEKYFESRLRASPLWVKKIAYKLQDVLPDHHALYSYGAIWDDLLTQYKKALQSSPLPILPMAFVDFDNTPRYKKRAKLFQGFSAELFEKNLRYLSELAKHNSPEEIVFINAWNEWGEGMYLQPEEDNDFSRLLAVKKCTASPVY